jgi:hypothetical protein
MRTMLAAMERECETEQISVRLPVWARQRLEQIAESDVRHGLTLRPSVSATIRRLVVSALHQNEAAA